MTSVSQNGWPVASPDQIDKSPILGRTFPNGFLKGDVFQAFTWLFTQLNSRVEPISMGNPADEWGYYVKKIAGSNSISNHASGTAGDYNASEHPMGQVNTYSATQRATIRQILDEAVVDGLRIFRWGGDYVGRHDDMHFEIVATPGEVHTFIKSLEKTGDDMFVKLGETGPWVKYWQNVLIRLGYDPGAKDGVYGPKMEAAINKSRKDNGQGPNPEVTEWHAMILHTELGHI